MIKIFNDCHDYDRFVLKNKLIKFIANDHRLQLLTLTPHNIQINHYDHKSITRVQKSIFYERMSIVYEHKTVFEDFIFILSLPNKSITFCSISLKIFCVENLMLTTFSSYKEELDNCEKVTAQLLSYVDSIQFPIFLTGTNNVIANFDIFKFSSEQILEFY
jgi:hypothetical protein